MAAIRSSNTEPELAVRSLLHRAGFRFRLHRSDLPGRPDITLPKYKTVIFVHGCFWHRHHCRFGKVTPATRKSFWVNKFKANKNRDEAAKKKLKAQGWATLVVWECQLKKSHEWIERLKQALGKRKH